MNVVSELAELLEVCAALRRDCTGSITAAEDELYRRRTTCWNTLYGRFVRLEIRLPLRWWIACCEVVLDRQTTTQLVVQPCFSGRPPEVGRLVRFVRRFDLYLPEEDPEWAVRDEDALVVEADGRQWLVPLKCVDVEASTLLPEKVIDLRDGALTSPRADLGIETAHLREKRLPEPV